MRITELVGDKVALCWSVGSSVRGKTRRGISSSMWWHLIIMAL